MATCMVTGGAGFLGSHLSDYLLERGHRVICVDSLETGSLLNIDHIRGDDFRFVMADITEHYVIDEPVDFVYHMASPASPIDYARLPLLTLKVGANGTHRWVFQAVGAGTTTFTVIEEGPGAGAPTISTYSLTVAVSH